MVKVLVIEDEETLVNNHCGKTPLLKGLMYSPLWTVKQV